MLEKLRPASSSTDHLFIGTDRYTYFSVSWDPAVGHLRTEKSYTDLSDKTGRDSQSGDRCLIDPSRRFMALGLFEGILTVLPLTHKSKKKGDPESGTPGEPSPVRIPELFLRSSAFLHSRNPASEKEKPKLALLYEDSHEKVGLKVRSLNYAAGGTGEPGSAEFIEEYRFQEQIDLGASHIIPVPAPSCECSYSDVEGSLTAARWFPDHCRSFHHICGRGFKSPSHRAPQGSNYFCYVDTD